MTLTADELNWTTQHMGAYKIPFQEVHDEVLDHIISAMEYARANGNTLPVARLFQDMIDEQFNGYIGIDEIVKTHEKAYQKKTNRIFRQNFRSIMDWKAIAFTTLLVILTHFIAPKILVTRALFVIILITVLVPMIYIYFATRVIKADKGKKSLVRRVLTANGFLPLGLVNCFLNLPNVIDDLNETRTIHFFMLNHPEIAALFLALTIVYSISSIYVCKQELASYKLSA